MKSKSIVVDTRDLGEDGLEIGQLYNYDTIILDLMLPNMDGYEVLRRQREAKVENPILILSGLANLYHNIKGSGLAPKIFSSNHSVDVSWSPDVQRAIRVQ